MFKKKSQKPNRRYSKRTRSILLLNLFAVLKMVAKASEGLYDPE